MNKFLLLFVPFVAFAEFGSFDSENLSQLTSNTGYIRTDVSDIETLIRDGVDSKLGLFNSWLRDNTTTLNPFFYIPSIDYSDFTYHVRSESKSYQNYTLKGGLFKLLSDGLSCQQMIDSQGYHAITYLLRNVSNSVTSRLDNVSLACQNLTNLVSTVINDNKNFYSVYTNLFNYSLDNISNELFQVISLLRSDTNIATQCRNLLDANTNILTRIEKINSLGFDNTTNSIVNFAQQVQDQYADYTNYLREVVFKLPHKSTQFNSYMIFSGNTSNNTTAPDADAPFAYKNLVSRGRTTFTHMIADLVDFSAQGFAAATRNQAQQIRNLQDIRRILTSWSNNVHVVVDSMPEININIPSNGLDRAYDQSSVIHSQIGYLWHPSVTNAITQHSELVAPQYNSVPLNGDFFHDVVNLLEGQIQQNNSANITLYTMLSLLQGTNATLEEVKQEVDDNLTDTQSAVSSAIASFTQPSNISALPDEYDLGQTLDLFQDVSLPSRVTIDMSTYAKNYTFLDKHLDGANFVWTIDIRPAFWCFRLMRAISIVLLVTIFIQFYFWLAYYFVKFVWYIGIIFVNRK